MKKMKKITAGVLSTLILASTVVGFAAEGDVYNSSDKSLYGTSSDIVRSKSMRRAVLTGKGKYLYEINELKYTLEDINKAYVNNKDDYKSEIKNNPNIYIPVDGNISGQDFIVESIE